MLLLGNNGIIPYRIAKITKYQLQEFRHISGNLFVFFHFYTKVLRLPKQFANTDAILFFNYNNKNPLFPIKKKTIYIFLFIITSNNK